MVMDETNISYSKGMLTLEEFGYYFAYCAKNDDPLPTINKIEIGVEGYASWPDENYRNWNNSFNWYDCGSVNTDLPNENYTEIKIWKEGVKIVFTEVTENFKEFIKGNEEYGWPVLYWG